MATLKELNLRLGSLRNTKKITQAMKMIATTKLNRSIQRVRGSENYQVSLNKIVGQVVREGEVRHDLLQPKNTIRNIKILLITTDRGLCGAFNSSLFREFNRFMVQCQENEIRLKMDYCGLKGYNLYQKSNIDGGENFEEIIKLPQYKDAVRIGELQLDELRKGEIDEFYVVYNHYQSALVQIPTIKKLIPFSFDESSESSTGLTYLEPSREALIEELIVKNFYFEIFYSLLNSVVGENSARMRAMDSATKNCDDMTDSITLQRNRVRQASITKELIEIISGAESL